MGLNSETKRPEEREGRGWRSQIAIYLERSQNMLHCMLYKRLAYGNTEINLILGEDIADFSAQQYNSNLRHVEGSDCFWSVGKSQECRM